MAMSRYKNFSKVRSSQIDYFRLETFPPISASELRNIPHTTIIFKETDRLDLLAEEFMGSATYWWVICLMNNLENPFSYKLLPGVRLVIPNDPDVVINMKQNNRVEK